MDAGPLAVQDPNKLSERMASNDLFGTVQTHDQYSCLRHAAGQMAQKRQRASVSPVEIVEDQQQRSSARRSQHELETCYPRISLSMRCTSGSEHCAVATAPEIHADAQWSRRVARVS